MANVNLNDVKLSSDTSDYQPESLIQAFQQTLKAYHSKPFLHYKKDKADKEWHVYTVQETYEKSRQFAKSLLSLNIKRFQSTNIIGFNSPEWFFSYFGTILAGGVAAGVYTTNNSDACCYIADHSDAIIIICDGMKQLEKYLKISEKLPALRALVVYNLPSVPESTKAAVPIYTLEQFMDLGKDIEDTQVDERMNAEKPEDLCSLIYTSGTTGNPKAVMLSHDNLTFTVRVVTDDVRDVSNDDRVVSYLPLSHVAAQLIDIIAPLVKGLQVYYGDADALRGTLGATIKQCHPTIFFGVPRVYEKIMEKMIQAGSQIHGIKKRLADWAKCKGLQKAELAQYGKSGGVPCGYGCANALVLSKVREILGFQHVKYFITSAAPIHKEVLDFFAAFDLYIYELYGESESTGPISYNLPGAWKSGSVGRAMRGTEVKIIPETQELVAKGRNNMLGYLKNEQATKETIDTEGYLHTGDMARIDEDGFIYITGRIKELIITAGGENIGPGNIESSILETTPGLSNVMLIGDKRKYLTALYTFATELDANGMPTPNLSKPVLEVGKSIGSTATTIAELKQCDKWQEHLKDGLKKANEKAASRACTVQKYTILDHDFSLATGELTPTLKLRRAIVAEKYKDVIEGMYKEDTRK